jgi:hypothetical protein
MPDEEDASHGTTDANRLRSCAREFLMLVHGTSTSPSRRRLAIHHMVKAVRYALPTASAEDDPVFPHNVEPSVDALAIDVNASGSAAETSSAAPGEERAGPAVPDT